MISTVKNPETFSWIHISDLHVGQDTQDWLWPTLQSAFYEDLERIFPLIGSLDLVVFSGDLTQKGSPENFALLKEILRKMWKKFNDFGSNPQLFIVPGNHDLVRPNKFDPTAAAMKSWWANADVRDRFWSSDSNSYRDFAAGLFDNYNKFRKDLAADGFPIISSTEGAIVGDVSTVLTKGDFRVGLIGLNSAYLHFFEDSTPSLDIHPKQLLSVTSADPDTWCKANDINFLVTHHPANWLHTRAASIFNGEINPPGRFTAHLFGHMHEPTASSTVYGGSPERRAIQGASLYGLKKIGDGRLERLHGYSLASINFKEEQRAIKFWPRVDKVMLSGVRRFVADTTFDLTEQNYFIFPLNKLNIRGEEKTLTVSQPKTSFAKPDEEAARLSISSAMGRITYKLKSGAQHACVRNLEQMQLKTALAKFRKAWIVADWGYGVEEFIASALVAVPTSVSAIHRFSLHDYVGRDAFFARFASETGRSFQDFAKAMFGLDQIVLIFDEVPVCREINPESVKWESEIASIVDAFLDYCPNSLVILISTQRPLDTAISVVEIRPLDEPDVRAYVLNHSKGGNMHVDGISVSDIYGLTDGLPIEIDSILNQLVYISLPELLELRLTSPRSDAQLTISRRGKFNTVDELRTSEDTNVVRAFGLLKALTVLPYGETLSRIKRFDSRLPFHPIHASILSDRGLIEALPVTHTLKTSQGGLLQSPKLLAKKAIREHVLGTLSPNELYELNCKAAAIYFGDGWTHGELKNIKTADIIAALGGDGGLGNPHAVINALFQYAFESGEAGRFKRIVQLARLFLTDLERGGNFRACAAACRDFLRIIPVAEPAYSDDRNWISYKLGVAVRMLGEKILATDIFSGLEIEKFEKRTRQRLLMNWALSEKFIDENKAKELAESVLPLGKGTFQAMHAQALILELSHDDPERFSKLRELEKRARSKKAITVADNILYYLSTNGGLGGAEKRTSLRSVAISARSNGDNYTAAKANAGIGKAATIDGLGLSRDELSGLIDSYHYLYQERISTLFASCHEGLWDYFIKNEDSQNLLRLFRHTSFIWRLHGEERREAPYVEALLDRFSGAALKFPTTHTPEFEYFLARSGRTSTLISS